MTKSWKKVTNKSLTRANKVASNQLAAQRVARAMRRNLDISTQISSVGKAFETQNAITRSVQALADTVPSPTISSEIMDQLFSIAKNPALDRLQNISNDLLAIGNSAANIANELSQSVNGLVNNLAIHDLANRFNTFQLERMPHITDQVYNALDALKPVGHAMSQWAIKERIAEQITDLGLVPHRLLWDYCSDLQLDETTNTEQLAIDIWHDLKEDLKIQPENTFDDKRLTLLYSQMLNAHDRGDYEIVFTALPTILERSVRLAVDKEYSKPVVKWMKEDVGSLPMHIVGHKGFRVWRLVTEFTFVSAGSDHAADAIKYPNRHVSAHGVGSKPTDNIKSLNTILLAHFIMELAYSSYQYNLQCEAA